MSPFIFKPTPAREAADFLRSKPVVSRQVFDGLLPELRARAFTVTGIEAHDVVQRLRDRVAKLPLGEDMRKIRKDLVAEMTPWLNEKGARARAEILLRHHGLQSYRVAQWDRVQRQKDSHPYLQYIATRDGRTRDRHAALNGIVLPVDDPFWQSHMPPWEWNCRCQIIQVSRARLAQLQARDEKLPPDEKLVLDEATRERMNTDKTLFRTVRGPDDRRKGVPTTMDIRTPEEKGRSGPGSQANLRIPLEDLRKRYDTKVWRSFEGWARKTDLGDGRTVMEWLEGAGPSDEDAGPASGLSAVFLAATALTQGKRMTPEGLAAWVREHPNADETAALTVWANDEEFFHHMKWDKTPEAEQWRSTMRGVLEATEPTPVEAPLWRGIRNNPELLERIRREKGYIVPSPGDSYSVNKGTSVAGYLGGGDGTFLIRLSNSRSGRDLRPVFAETGGKAAGEEEYVFPGESAFRLIREEEENVDTGGQIIRVPVLYIEEVKP